MSLSTESGPQTMWQRIAGDLSAGIADGRFKPGEPLPTALSLAERYGVHRHTARQALLHLQQQGLVSVERGRGSFVSSERIPYRLGRRVRFRANAGASGASVETRVVGVIASMASEIVARALQIPLGEPVWEIATVSLADGVAISTGTHHLGRNRFPDFPRRLEEAGGSMTRAFQLCDIPDYVRLSTALVARPATVEEAERLGLEPDAPVMQSRAIDGLPDGEPFHLVASAFAGSRVEFMIEPEAEPSPVSDPAGR